MGYNLTRKSVIRNKPQLEQLARSETSLTFPHEHPSRLASKIREAIKASKKFPEFKEFHDLNEKFVFRERPYHVYAEIQTKPVGIPVEGEPGYVPPPTPKPKPPEKKVIQEAFGILDIMAVAMKFEEDREIYFPNAVLTIEDLEKLHKWVEDKEWQIINQADRGTTITKKELPEGVAWSPKEPKEEIETNAVQENDG